MVSNSVPPAQNAEKLITFTGDGTSAMQVFNIDATQLSSDGYRGVDFNFTNIPGNASVVVNVSGGNVEFPYRLAILVERSRDW